MTTTTITGDGEIVLNALVYPIKGQVRSGLISTDALKIVTADQTRDSHPRLSIQSWENWQRGIGKDKYDGQDPAGTRRAWDSELQLRFDGHLVLPGLDTLTAAGAAADVGVISELANVIYAAFGVDFRSFNDTTNVWTNVATLPAAATDEVNNVRLDGTVYMIIAHTGGYTYTSDGAVFTNDTKDTKYLVMWDQRLWGIDADGQLWWAFTPGTEVDDAKIQLENGVVTGMFVGFDRNGNDIIYVATTRGLFAHDIGNRKFAETRLRLPFHPDNGKGSVTWRDSMYFSAGLAISKYDIDANRATVDQMGPDRDDGLPSNRRGFIRRLVSSHNEVLAIIDATAIASGGNIFQSDVSSNNEVIDPDQGFSHIMGWDKLGWERKWLSDDSTSGITWLHVSDAYNQYRMWWSQNQRIRHMRIPQNIINPVYVTDLPYAASGNHETPDFTGGQSEVDKLAVRLRVEFDDMSSTETAVVSFALNGSSTFTIMDSVFSTSAATTTGLVTANGVATYRFSSIATPQGTAFRSIRFKVALARGSTTTLTPDVLRIDFEWRKKLPALWGHQVTVDLSNGYNGQTREEMFENLRIAAENNVLSRFTFRDRDADDAGNSNPWVYFVDIIAFDAIENTGNVWTGEFNLVLAEV